MYFTGLSGIIGLIILLLDIWACFQILQSSADTVSKVVWIIIIFVLPLLGFVLWYVAGPGSKKI